MVYVFTAETLPVEQLLRQFGRPVQQQGEALYKQGLAKVEQSAVTNAVVKVEEPPRPPQQVRIFLSGSVVSHSCTCRESYGWGPCKHKAAALLALRDHLAANPPRIWQAILDKAIQPPTRRSAAPPSGNMIIFSLQTQGSTWSVTPYSLSGKLLPPDHGGDPDTIAAAVERGRLSFQLKNIRSQVTPDSYPLVASSAVAAANTIIGSGGGYGYWYASARALPAVLAMLAGALVYQGSGDDPLGGGRVFVHDQPASIALDLAREGQDLTATFTVTLDGRQISVRPGRAQIITRDPTWMLVDEQLFRLADTGVSPEIVASYPRVRIPAADEDAFLEQYLLPLSENVPVRGSAVQWEELQAEPEARLYLSEREGDLVAELRYAYGAFELPYDKALPAETVRRVAGRTALMRIKRDPAKEQAAWQEISAGYGLKRGTTPSEFLLRKNTAPADFLLREIPKLANTGMTIFGEEALTLARVNRSKPTISFNVSSGIDWFDVEAVVQFGDQMLPLKDLKRALKRRDRYVKLADGSLGMIPEEWTERYRHLFAFADDSDKGLRLANHHLTLIDDVLADADRAQADAAFHERRERLRNFERIEPVPLPAGFSGQLRDYQKAGYDWLHFLRKYGFGGCLADDMGLGKTIQALAFLQSLYEREPQAPASLIVMPRSLLFNWQREAAQFTPGLRVAIHADQGRATEIAEFAGQHLILTTYGVMLRDVELLRQYRFHTLILDESQAIKNPIAETSRAVRQLQGEQRIALTGTPLENSTAELWSQFAFLNPGLLGSLEYFREGFVTPIERKQDEGASQFLRRMVFPFILRRTKEQVAVDLPPRSEELLVTEMEPAQRKLYIKTRDYYRALLLGLIDEEGLDDARMKILEGLLRLRQICNHPRLVDAKAKGSSGKFELLLETLDTLRAEGHKALIFSQFVQMLTLIREALDERGVPYAYLDGSTRNRKAEVDRFQSSPDLPFFLISLKAGGVGLNLTAADYVIHVDPWWNPAVEMQATDRTHRIGQTKPVFVYKLITEGTVEEKILKLQDQKRALVSQIISAEGGVFKSLTREDIEVLFT